MRDIVGPLRRVALDWTPDWTRERTLESGIWTLDHHRGDPWTRHPCFVYILEKRRAGGLRVRARERLKYF